MTTARLAAGNIAGNADLNAQKHIEPLEGAGACPITGAQSTSGCTPPQATGTSASLIACNDVHVSYPGSEQEALRGVTFSVPAGQHVCILGGNGSGKSTLLQLFNALVLPSEGSVTVFGMRTDEPGQALAIRSRAAYVFQHPEDQMVTSIVADDVAFGPENIRVPQPEIEHRVETSLAAVDMSAHAQADPADLSGGQKQRVAIAGALAMEPEILLLDEPCAMLDLEGRRAVSDIIERLSACGITIMHVTHFMDDALAADRVLILDQGRLAFDGTPSEAFSQPELIRELGLELPNKVHTAEELFGKHAETRGTANASAASTLHSTTRHAAIDAAATRTSTLAPHAAARPSIVFEDVSFSYTAARNPRKRARTLFGVHRKRGENATLQAQQQARQRIAGNMPLALEHLSFNASPGTLTALIGRTGSGKSTSAELACALKLPYSGRVLVDGIDTTDLSRRSELRRKVGYVSQLPERQLFAETVFDDVAFGPRNLKLPEEEVAQRVNRALETVGMNPSDDLLNRSPFALSGGQQRNVALAGVLAMGQPILVLDEPMAGLDPRGRANVRLMLHELKQAGTTLLMVTHSMEDVLELADQVILLDQGKLVAAGTPQAVLAQARDGEVQNHGATR
ncbi:ABC transporter ATP-binding protein [Collinsella provencensis]|uniref:ABC transporter ATP-binding protein n=1 Tax=Collinsella provencensis TaxID=1937461 RepID=UPI000C83637D|nr:energy-coupling factor transporter ATPase [Collinsella provencensis]